MKFLRQVLTPPEFDDERKTQKAYMLHLIVWALIVVPVVYLIFTVLFVPANIQRAFIQALFGETVNFILLFLMRRGFIQAASIAQVSAFWFFFTITALTGDRVQGEAYLLGYALVITIAGILLGGGGALTFTILSIAAGAYMLTLPEKELASNDPSNATIAWVVSILLFLIIALLQYIASNRVQVSLKKAQISEERYRLISRVSSDYTFSTDVGEDGKLHLNWVAGAFEEMTGYTYGDYIAAGGWFTHLHTDDVEVDKKNLDRILSNEKVISEVRTFTKSKEVRWVRVYGHPVWDERNNRLKGIVGAVQDITEQKNIMEREISRQASLQKVLSLGKFVTESTDLHTTYERIWSAVRNDLKFDRLGIYIYNADKNLMEGTYGTNNDGEMVDEADKIVPMDNESLEAKTFTKVLSDANGFYFTHTYNQDYDVAANPIMLSVRDYAAVAAWAGNKPIGVLCVDNAITQQPISAEDLESLRLFAGFAGLAIANTRLNNALQHELSQQRHAEETEAARRAMLEKVVVLGKKVTETHNTRRTLELIWHGVHDTLGFDRMAVFMYNKDHNALDSMIGTDADGNMEDTRGYLFPITEEQSTFKRVLEQREGFFLSHNYDVEHNIPANDEMYGVKDYAAVAAWAGDIPVAVICVDMRVTGRRFTDIQVEALRLFSGYAGLAIANSQLHETLEKELQQRQLLINNLEEKNAELERFTYTVSHDLKSPLVTITGFLGYLKQDSQQGNIENIAQNIERISNAAKKMHTLLNDLLELSRIGRLMNQPEDIPFREIVNEAIERVRGRLDRINANVTIAPDLPVIHGDRVRLIEVVQNIVENAAKYIGPEKEAHIDIGLSNTSENGHHVFYIRDNGKGIAPQYHERIFGLFNKLDPNSEGTGIGLSLVRRIVEVHNGKVWVESEPGDGAVFFFSLPGPQSKE